VRHAPAQVRFDETVAGHDRQNDGVGEHVLEGRLARKASLGDVFAIGHGLSRHRKHALGTAPGYDPKYKENSAGRV